MPVFKGCPRFQEHGSETNHSRKCSQAYAQYVQEHRECRDFLFQDVQDQEYLLNIGFPMISASQINVQKLLCTISCITEKVGDFVVQCKLFFRPTLIRWVEHIFFSTATLISYHMDGLVGLLTSTAAVRPRVGSSETQGGFE